MRRETIEALVLSRRNAGEAGRLVTFFTRERGLMRVLAPGVRKIPSRRGGHLEPLTIVRAAISGKDGHWYLNDVETMEYLQLLRADEELVSSAQFLAHLATGFFEYETPYPAIFAVIKKIWQELPRYEGARRALLEAAAALLILREAGVMPSLKACRECGAASPLDQAWLDPERTGWLCRGCGPGAAGPLLTPRVLASLRAMAAAPAGGLRVARLSAQESSQLRRSVRWYARRAAFAVS